MSDEQFKRIAEFFCNLKFLHGNDFVNSTLRRHSALNKKLLEYEKQRIIDIERELDVLEN